MLTTDKHLLYVDDESALVSLSVRGLRQLGYRVTGFSDPQQALASFKAEPQVYDAVITDLAMPKLSGLSLANEVKSLRHVPVIAMSGFVSKEDRERCDACGIQEVLAKPFTLDHLKKALERLFA